MTSVRATTVWFDDVAVGDVLPELDIPITRTLIVAAAIASRDYQDVHHDPELAVARGSPDIFMNILTTNGLVGRFVTDWAGPGAVLTDVSIRLGVPNYPGDVMVLSGTVTGVSAATDRDGGGPEHDGHDGHDGADATSRGRVEIAVRGANRLGDHVTGNVGLTLPRRSGADESPAAHDAPGSGPGGAG